MTVAALRRMLDGSSRSRRPGAAHSENRSKSIVPSKTRKVPSWSAVKAKLAHFDRAGLIGLLGDLHGFSRDNQAFLNSRLGVGVAQLTPYKQSIAKWICPDLSRNQDISVAKAKKAIADYRKAIGTPDGIAELSVFYCEQAVRLSSDCGLDDEGYFLALVRMFDKALVVVMSLEPPQRLQLLDRLGTVRSKASAIGWGVKDAMDDSWVQHADGH